VQLADLAGEPVADQLAARGGGSCRPPALIYATAGAVVID